ncbi:MAG: potassium transporter, partial [Gemmobacter sp.]|nr:potassium transporter [Gemmobacter sp.]
INDAAATTKIEELAKHEFPLVPVLARAHDREHALDLVKAGVDFQMRETFESALMRASGALRRLSDDPEETGDLRDTFRNRDMERFALECVGGIFAGRDLVLGNRTQADTEH